MTISSIFIDAFLVSSISRNVHVWKAYSSLNRFNMIQWFNGQPFASSTAQGSPTTPGVCLGFVFHWCPTALLRESVCYAGPLGVSSWAPKTIPSPLAQSKPPSIFLKPFVKICEAKSVSPTLGREGVSQETYIAYIKLSNSFNNLCSRQLKNLTGASSGGL